jgi:hypothetical protein
MQNAASAHCALTGLSPLLATGEKLIGKMAASILPASRN